MEGNGNLIWVQNVDDPSSNSTFKVFVTKNADIDDLKDGICSKQCLRGLQTGVNDIFHLTSQEGLGPGELVADYINNNTSRNPLLFNSTVYQHKSIDSTNSTYAIAVYDVVECRFQVSGNAFAITPTKILTAFHNIYDEIKEIPGLISSNKVIHPSSFIDHNAKQPVRPVLLSVFNQIIIFQKATKYSLDANSIQFHDTILAKLVDSDFQNDWAVFEIVKGESEYYGLSVQINPPSLKKLRICPDNLLAIPGKGKVKAYHYDINFSLNSIDYQEVLICQCGACELITLYKEQSHLFRVKGGLSKGSAGAPYIDATGRVVAMHLASADSSLMTESKARLRKGGKRAKLTLSNLKKITNCNSEVVIDELIEDSRIVLSQSEISSIQNCYNFTAYK